MRMLIRMLGVAIASLPPIASVAADLPAVPMVAQVGDILVADPRPFSEGPALFLVHQTSGVQQLVSAGGELMGPTAVSAFALDAAYVCDVRPSGVGAVVRVDLATGTQSVVSEGGNLSGPLGIVAAPDGKLYVSSTDMASIVSVDPTSGEQLVVASGGNLLRPAGIVFGLDGALYVADFGNPPGVPGKLIRIDSLSGDQTVLARASGFGIAQDAGGEFYLTGLNGRGLESLLRVSTSPVVVSEVLVSGARLISPRHLASGRDGHLYVMDQISTSQFMDGSGSVVRIDPASGAGEYFSEGDLFRAPIGICILGVRNGATRSVPATWGRIKERYLK